MGKGTKRKPGESKGKKPEEIVKDAIKAGLEKRRPDVHWHMPQGSTYGVNGAPDFTICVRGFALFVETKARGKLHNTSGLQEEQLDLWAKAGAIAVVADSAEAVLWLVDGLLSRAERVERALAPLYGPSPRRARAIRVRAPEGTKPMEWSYDEVEPSRAPVCEAEKRDGGRKEAESEAERDKGKAAKGRKGPKG